MSSEEVTKATGQCMQMNLAFFLFEERRYFMGEVGDGGGEFHISYEGSRVLKHFRF